MSKLKINFDFDSVLVETIKGIHDVYVNRHYDELMNGSIKMPFPHSVRKWNLEDQYPLLDIKQLDSIFQSEELFNCLSFITDPNGYSMKQLFSELCMDEHFDIHIATRGSEGNLKLKQDFVRKEFPNWLFNMDNFHGMLGTKMEKSAVNGWLLIDDVVNNLVTAKTKHKILFAHRGHLDCEWNHNYKDYPELIVCTTVQDLCNKIVELYNFERSR